jgi:adenine phosphoribosyltransferase
MSDPVTVEPDLDPTDDALAEGLEGLEGRLRAGIRDVPDYPSPGILFKDVTPLLADASLFGEAVAGLAAGFVRADSAAPGADAVDGSAGFDGSVASGGVASGALAVDVVAGIEARGFIFGAPVARALGVGFVPIRKGGKLPFTTVSAEYALEYGAATIEVHTDAVQPGQRVLLLDDVLATGGTAEAAARLMEDLGAEVVAVTFLMELATLGGRARLAGRDVRCLVGY